MSDTFKAMTVEFIRQLWNRTPITNIALNELHDAWFQYWVDWKVEQTMDDVDAQIEELVQPTEVDKPIFSEEEDGTLRLRSPWLDDD